MKRRPYDSALEVINCYQQDYRGYEISAHLSGHGGLSVIVYEGELSELVWRGDNIIHARLWIDEQVKDRADV
jgi:hypothetical protein